MPHSSVPATPRRLIVATSNPGKLREFQALLAGLPFELRSLADLHLPSPEETGGTFRDNALLKARHAAAGGCSAAVADDSGLEVDALDGAPGIFSARFAGPAADDAANNAKLVAALRGVPAAQRSARYHCCLAFVRDGADAAPLIAEAVWEGLMLDSPRGSGGFGYDPYFFLPQLNVTAAQLAADVKNRLSHRGRALRALRVLLDSTP